jgi:hypothetical protein
MKFGREISRPAGLQFVAKTWRSTAPVTGWLDKHVGASVLPTDGRRRRAEHNSEPENELRLW